MGEANRKREMLRLKMLAECDQWDKLETSEEAELAAEVARLPHRRIRRADQATLDYMRMLPQECHQNCHAYAKMDPDGDSRMVSGWWKIDDNYVVHSVIENSTGMICITPHMNVVEEIDFVPDPKITWQESNGRLTPLRNGNPLPKIVRGDPKKMIALAEGLRERLLAGMDPRKAMQEFPT